MDIKNMNNKVLLLIFFFLSSFSFSMEQDIDRYNISILTVSPGKDLVDAFGHSGIRVVDNELNYDVVFNFGIYDFQAPDFYSNFVKGRPIYSLGINNYNRFFNDYKNQKRGILEHKIQISKNKKDALIRLLFENSRQENKFYVYEYFNDNCSTKVADLFIENFNDEIFNSEINLSGKSNDSYRSLIYKMIPKNSWGSLGIDICLGSIIDQDISYRQTFFLPSKFGSFLDTIESVNPEIIESKLLLKSQDVFEESSFNLTSPLFVILFISILTILVSFRDYRNNKQTKILDILLISITTMIGLLISYLWFYSDHSAASQNYNILWASPLNILLFIDLFTRKKRKWILGYLKFIFIMLLLMMSHWILSVQTFNITLFSFIFALLIRYIFLIYNHKKLIS
jgi:hypothetical protein